MRAATGLALALIVPVVALVPSANAGTPLALTLSHGQSGSLEQQLRDELHALDAFARGRAAGAQSGAAAERPGTWILFGRLGPLKFRNELDSQSSSGMRLGMGSGGPRLTGRIHIGIYRQFD